MTSKRRFQASTLVALVALGLVAAASGCEIIANFDRSLIPADGGPDALYELDSAEQDAPTAETGVDATAPDTGSQPDGGIDAADAMIDAPDASDAKGTGTDASDAGEGLDAADASDATVAEADASDSSVADTSPPIGAGDDAGDGG